MSAPYYQDDKVTLYHGDCLEHPEWWTGADVLVTDPPYGRAWRQGDTDTGRGWSDNSHEGIAGDSGTMTRDLALTLWDGPAVVFGDLMLAPPGRAQQVLIYAKPVGSGVRGATGGYRRDAEAIYLMGHATGLGGRSSVLRTAVANGGGPGSPAGRYDHPHAKPLDLMEALVCVAPPGTITDPFAGSGSTLVAAKALGRNAVGVELEERYCEIAARRLSQEVFDFGSIA